MGSRLAVLEVRGLGASLSRGCHAFQSGAQEREGDGYQDGSLHRRRTADPFSRNDDASHS